MSTIRFSYKCLAILNFTAIAAGAITATEDLTLHKTSEYEVYVIVNDERRSDGPKTLTVKLTGIQQKNC